MYHKTMLLQTLFVFLASFAVSLMACSCKRYHPQEQFCQADYVLRVKVIGPVRVDRCDENHRDLRVHGFEKIYYPIRIIKVYKGNISSLINLKTIRRRSGRVRYVSRVYIPSRVSSCSLSLTRTQVYVIMGQTHQGVLHHGLCDWRAKWQQVTSVQQRGLKRQYAKGCECSIRTCPTRGWCNRTQLPTECRWVSDYGYGVTKCVHQWQVCKYNSISRRCKWRKPEHSNFKKCIKQVRWP